jgi:primosomal protein N' (replication factor Y)
VSGAAAAVLELIQSAALPDPHEVIGPVPLEDGVVRMLVRVPRDRGGELAAAMHAAAGLRSARKAPDPVKIVMDPVELF